MGPADSPYSPPDAQTSASALTGVEPGLLAVGPAGSVFGLLSAGGSTAA
jgi:hypothetical protein